MNQPPSQSTSSTPEEAITFLYGLSSELYIQLALVTEQLGSLTKILWSKGLLSEEEVMVINDDMETLIEQFASLANESGSEDNDTEE